MTNFLRTIAAFAFLFLICTSQPAQAQVVTCDPTVLLNAVNAATTSTRSVIDLQPGCIYTYSSATANDAVFNVGSGSLTLNGNGAIIERDPNAPLFRLFYVIHGNLTLNNVTVRGGNVSGAGGAILSNGSILNIIDSTFVNNTAGSGGAIISRQDEGMIAGNTFTGNTAQYGGAMDMTSAGGMRFFNNTFSNNYATQTGGAMQVSFSAAMMSHNTFIGNRTDGNGGALEMSGSSVIMTDSLFSGNSAGNYGGAWTYTGSAGKFINLTFAGNRAGSEGGAMRNSGTNPTFTNVIIWGNSEPQITSSAATYTHSIVPAGITGTNTQSVDPLFVNPIDYSLAPTIEGDYRLLPGSPAINMGNNAAIPADILDVDNDGNTAEQVPHDRDGQARIFDTTVDAGAYEYFDPCAAYLYPYTVPAGDTTSLVEAIQCAHQTPEWDIIELTNSTYTFTSASDVDATIGDTALPRISTFMFIKGNGATITRDINAPAFRMLRVESFINLQLEDVTISGGSVTGDGGAVYNSGVIQIFDSAFSGNSAGDDGGAIYNQGAVEITNSSFSDNSATGDGGGISNNGRITVTDSTFSGNDAANGGAVSSIASVINLTGNEFINNNAVKGGAVHAENNGGLITDNTFSQNTAENGGAYYGIIRRELEQRMFKNTFSDNHATVNGGAMHVMLRESGLDNNTFIGNSAGSNGGALYLWGGSATISNSLFAGNDAGNDGGALHNIISSVQFVNLTFAGNSADNQGGAINNSGTNPKFTNVIVWGNSEAQITGNLATFNHSIVPVGVSGTNNLSVDPLFVFPVDFSFAPTTDGDYHLQEDSPAINMGDNSALIPDYLDIDQDDNMFEPSPHDLDNADRIKDDVVDMGAYERARPAGVILSQITVDAAEGGATGSYTVQLNSKPSTEVTVNINGDSQVRVSPLSLTFTPDDWSTAQTVTVTAIEDAVEEGIHTGSITHSVTSDDSHYHGIEVSDVTVNITDNDLPITETPTDEPATPTETAVQPTPTLTAVPVTETPTIESATATPTLQPFTATPDSSTPTSTPLPFGSVELLANGGFEIASAEKASLPANWTPRKLVKDKRKCNTETTMFAYRDDCAFLFRGGLFENAKLMQSLNLNGYVFEENDTLTFKIHHRTKGTTAPRLKLKLSIVYTDETVRHKATINVVKPAYSLYEMEPYRFDAGNVISIKAVIQNKTLSGKVFIDEASVIFDAADDNPSN